MPTSELGPTVVTGSVGFEVRQQHTKTISSRNKNNQAISIGSAKQTPCHCTSDSLLGASCVLHQERMRGKLHHLYATESGDPDESPTPNTAPPPPSRWNRPKGPSAKIMYTIDGLVDEKIRHDISQYCTDHRDFILPAGERVAETQSELDFRGPAFHVLTSLCTTDNEREFLQRHFYIAAKEVDGSREEKSRAKPHTTSNKRRRHNKFQKPLHNPQRQKEIIEYESWIETAFEVLFSDAHALGE